MADRIAGIHHITAITADAQKNIDFYTGALGLRLVKVTVNFDDPTSYHLYYGDEVGSPGSAMTFFAWPGGRRGRPGPPQAVVTGFSVPRDSLDWWESRLAEHGVEMAGRLERFDDDVLELLDPDGMRLELVAGGAEDPRRPWADGPVPPERGIRGFHGVTLAEEACEHTAELLTEVMGFEAVAEGQSRFRYAGPAPGGVVDLVCVPGQRRGSMGAGIVHHVALRAADEGAHARWRERLAERGLNVTPIIERMYFRSIYFREPGGVLLEIATDGPGFTIDESADALGSGLRLPPQHAPARAQIEAALPRITLPDGSEIP